MASCSGESVEAVRGCQWSITLVSEELKKSHLVRKKMNLVSKQRQKSLVNLL